MNDPLSTIHLGLNPAQLEAVTHGDGPLLIVAGAGTGKTTVLTKRFAHLILSGQAKPDEVLALTFTEKAAEEMEQRIDKLMPYGYVDLWVQTFHAMGERLLRNHGLSIGLPDSFTVLSETDQWMLVHRNLHRFNLDYYRPLGNPTKFIHALLRHFSRAKDELVGPDEYLAYVQSVKLDQDKTGDTDEATRVHEVANAYHVYTQLLREHDALDFGDLINETVRLFKTRPHILEKYRRQFKFILVDEFQDTNIAQFELIRLLGGIRANLTVVGDDDQSVYKFRGASVSNILQFSEYYPSALRVVLTQNYRSPQKILDAAYSFIQGNNPNRLEVKLGDGLSKKLTSHISAPGAILNLHAETVFDEARMVARHIADVISKDSSTNYSEFAILVRANDSATPFIAALMAAGIPYQFLASRGLYQKPVVLDIVNYLKLLDNYHESPSMYRMLASPVVDLAHDDVLKLTHAAHKRAWSLYEAARQAPALALSAPGLIKVSKFLSLVERHTQMTRDADVRRVVFAFLEDSGYLRRLTGDDNQLTRETLAYINQFWRKIEAFVSAEPEPTVHHFLERIRLELEAGESGTLAFDPDVGPDTVKILTVHSAKGLEFDYVFLVSLVDRKFPAAARSELIELPAALVKEIVPIGDHHLEEERRLFYVGMTRAKKALIFTSADDYGGARKRKLSRFLVELGYTVPDVIPAKAGVQNDWAVDSPAQRDPVRGTAFLRGNDGAVDSSVAKLPVRDQFSYTQLKAFETCPLQYKFAHVLKIPVRGRATFSFGKTIHLTLQKFYALISERQGSSQGTLFNPLQAPGSKPIGELVREEELIDLYRANWIDDWFQSPAHKEQYREKGMRILQSYYATVKDERVHPLFLEKPFRLRVGDATLRGAIDRIDRLADGTVRIVDYKTGKPKADDEVERDQLLIYQAAATEVLGEKPSLLTYYFLEDGRTVNFLGTDEELAALKLNIHEAVAKIRASSFHPTPGKMACDHCDFRDICEFRAA